MNPKVQGTNEEEPTDPEHSRSLFLPSRQSSRPFDPVGGERVSEEGLRANELELSGEEKVPGTFQCEHGKTTCTKLREAVLPWMGTTGHCDVTDVPQPVPRQTQKATDMNQAEAPI